MSAFLQCHHGVIVIVVFVKKVDYPGTARRFGHSLKALSSQSKIKIKINRGAYLWGIPPAETVICNVSPSVMSSWRPCHRCVFVKKVDYPGMARRFGHSLKALSSQLKLKIKINRGAYLWGVPPAETVICNVSPSVMSSWCPCHRCVFVKKVDYQGMARRFGHHLKHYPLNQKSKSKSIGELTYGGSHQRRLG